jgi:hypothetical protein
VIFFAEFFGTFALATAVLNAGTSADYEGNSFFGLGKKSIFIFFIYFFFFFYFFYFFIRYRRNFDGRGVGLGSH